MSNIMNIAIFTIVELLIIIIFYQFLSKHTTNITFLSIKLLIIIFFLDSCNFF